MMLKGTEPKLSDIDAKLDNLKKILNRQSNHYRITLVITKWSYSLKLIIEWYF